MKKVLSVILGLSLLLTAFNPIIAYAESDLVIENGIINLTAEQLSENPAAVIEDALLLAKDNGTASAPITVNVPSGTYNMSKCLHIYSNTRLISQPDTVYIRTFTNNNLLKAGLKSEVNSGYNGYVNIVISGGVWDCNFSGNSCGMRFAHCNNVLLENVTILNNKNSHHMELAGSNNFRILNCTFSGYQRNNSGDGEAIQIDILHNETHFPSYREFDDTPCKNITVKGCTFDNVYAGVGTRSGVIGSYFEKINITDNTFNNVRDKAICAFNYRNSVIENNRINYSTIGIIFEYYPASNLTGKLYMPNSKKASTAIVTNANCRISKNRILVKNNTLRSNSAGIALYGGRIDAALSKKTGLQAGAYNISNVTLNNNVIYTNSKSSGILLNYVYNSKLLSNAIRSNVSEVKGYHGISLTASSNNQITANRIERFYNGINLLSSSQKNSIARNAIIQCSNFAFAAEKNSGAVIECNNAYSGNKVGRYMIAGKAYTDGATPSIKVKRKNNINTLTWKKISGASGYRIYRSTSKASGFVQLKTYNSKTLTAKDKSLKKKTKYYYRMITYKSIDKTVIYSKTSNTASA